MGDIRGFEALVVLVQAWHDNTCTSMACPCSDQMARDAASVIHSQIIEDYEAGR